MGKEGGDFMAKKERTQAGPGYERRRKTLAIVSLIVVVVLVGLLTLFVWRWLSSFSQDDFRDYIRSYGAVGWLILLGLQVLQVFIALIPGELLETAAGYIFGPILGTILCYVGLTIGTVIVFLLTRRYGTKLTEIFISREKINDFRFINTEKKRDRLIFLMFFIPGTPKDLLTYFVGLTDIKLSSFLVISLVARIPSVLSSTFGGHLLGEGQYWGAIILYGITGGLSILGLWLYRVILRHRQNKNH